MNPLLASHVREKAICPLYRKWAEGRLLYEASLLGMR